MTKEHPITPPPGLIKNWCASRIHEKQDVPLHVHVATQAARWGADQELEACLMEIRDGAGRIYIDETKLRVCLADDIWTARRPKPPSLKEQAVFAAAVLRSPDETCSIAEIEQHWHTIRRALESLPD